MKQSSSVRIRSLTAGAMTAALYVVLTFLAKFFGLDSGAIQLRFSEALCILPVFFPSAIPGLFVGCLLANLLTGCMALDIALGSFATLLGAVSTYLIRKGPKFLLPLPNVFWNTLICTPVIWFCYTDHETVATMFPMFLTVGAGEILSSYVLGMLLYFALKPYAKILFPASESV